MFNVYEDNSEEAIRSCHKLAEQHYYEVEGKSSTIPFALDIGMLIKCSEMGLLSLVVVEKGGVVVGYMANLVSPDLMTSKLVAKELGIYLDPSVRGSKAFIIMMRYVEKAMRERGVTAQILAFKEGHDTGLAQRLGYSKTETIYQKLLGE